MTWPPPNPSTRLGGGFNRRPGRRTSSAPRLPRALRARRLGQRFGSTWRRLTARISQTLSKPMPVPGPGPLTEDRRELATVPARGNPPTRRLRPNDAPDACRGSGNWPGSPDGTCSHCGQKVTLDSYGKLATHTRAAVVTQVNVLPIGKQQAG